MKKNAPFLFLTSIVVCGLSTFADTIPLPCRYVVTSYNVHLLTGSYSNESTKEKLLQRPVEVTKYVADGVAKIKFTAKSKRGTDRSEDEVATTDFAKKEDLLKALKAIYKKQNDQHLSAHPSDSSEKVYDNGDITLTIIATGREVFGELNIGDAVIVLRERIDMDGLHRIISNLK